MKILIASHSFSPNIGGIEQVTATLAEQFVTLGHDVVVMTRTANGAAVERESGEGYRVERQVGYRRMLALFLWCDVHLQSNITLHALWLALLVRRPTLVVYHTWLARPDGRRAWQDRLKNVFARVVSRNLAVSERLAHSIGPDCKVIANPYDAKRFRLLPEIAQDGDLLFLGRLVSDKGADGLLDTLDLLAKRGSRPSLTIVGSGPQESGLREQVARLGLEDQVAFAGALRGEALIEALNRHRVLVVPSRWAEPFGMVVLEGLACGMQVIVSDRGGLPEAIGSCGMRFEGGNWAELADRITDALNPALHGRAAIAPATLAHLEHYNASTVALDYLRHFEAIAPARPVIVATTKVAE